MCSPSLFEGLNYPGGQEASQERAWSKPLRAWRMTTERLVDASRAGGRTDEDGYHLSPRALSNEYHLKGKTLEVPASHVPWPSFPSQCSTYCPCTLGRSPPARDGELQDTAPGEGLP